LKTALPIWFTLQVSDHHKEIWTIQIQLILGIPGLYERYFSTSISFSIYYGVAAQQTHHNLKESRVNTSLIRPNLPKISTQQQSTILYWWFPLWSCSQLGTRPLPNIMRDCLDALTWEKVKIQNSEYSTFSFLVAFQFELRASQLPGKCSVSRVISQAFFALVILRTWYSIFIKS
jgi:hypothetical protein